ncbi:MAG: MBL fold metallo-hydrolase [bacterium]|nr:MBL fold metallo-hydrolase [bacterium]
MKKIAYGMLAFLSLLAFELWGEVMSRDKIVFFDVGQGDSIFIESSSGHQILIDGGPGSQVLQNLSRQLPFWDRSLDLIILTHPDYDHISGLIDVLKRYKVDSVLWNGVVRETAEWDAWDEELNGVERVAIAEAGQRVAWDGFSLEILHPFEIREGEVMTQSNDSSIVALLTGGKRSILLTGDISGTVERDIALAYPDLRADILKVAHHGSAFSSTPIFLRTVLPFLAVIEVGEGNSYGHPAPPVLALFAQYGIQVLRTDEEGDISLAL